MQKELDFTAYKQLPIFDLNAGLALATALCTAQPPHAPVSAKRAAEELRASADALATAWRDAQQTPDEKRAADYGLDHAWGNFFGRLECAAGLPVERHPTAARAKELLEKLFPSGLTFLRLPYAEEWAESEQRLARITAEGWTKELERLAGREFLEELKLAHERYGIVLGITQRVQRRPAPALAERLRELRRRMNHYVITLLAYAADDDEAARAVRHALRPIDELRAANSARRAKASNAAPAEAPTPLPRPATPPPSTP